jgi:hypothetical protein
MKAVTSQPNTRKSGGEGLYLPQYEIDNAPGTLEIETLPSDTPRRPELLDDDMPAITWGTETNTASPIGHRDEAPQMNNARDTSRRTTKPPVRFQDYELYTITADAGMTGSPGTPV